MTQRDLSEHGSALIDLADARLTVVASLAWRAIAEIARRRGRTLEARLVQFHPGASSRGVIRLRLFDMERGARVAEVDFNLGGPSGTYRGVDQGSKLESGSLAGLLYEHPEATIDEIERNIGLPALMERLPESTSRVLALRVVAGVLERRMFDSKSWRASLAVWDWSGGHSVNDWHASVLGKQISLDREGSLSRETHKRLSDLVLIHTMQEEIAASGQAAALSHGLAVDLDTGMVCLVIGNKCKPLGDCRNLYQAHKRSMRDLVTALDRQLPEP